MMVARFLIAAWLTLLPALAYAQSPLAGISLDNPSTVPSSGPGSGDVVGPASSTDNAIARFDSTTGKLVQNSAVIVGDTGTVLVPSGVLLGWGAFNSANSAIKANSAVLEVRLGDDTGYAGIQTRDINVNSSDTTVARSSAGHISVEGAVVPLLADTNAWTGQNSFSNSSFPPVYIERTTAATAGVVAAYDLRATSSGNMTDTFGPVINFSIIDNAAVLNKIADIGAERAGADNTGDFVVGTLAAGVRTERLRVSSTGAVTGPTNVTSADLTSTDDVLVGDDIVISSASPVINFEDTDAPTADGSISFNSGVGSVFYSADTANAVAGTVHRFDVDNATKLTINNLGPMLPAAVAAASLGTCDSTVVGTLRTSNDAVAVVPKGTTAAGGGSAYSVLVCNGTNWVGI